MRIGLLILALIVSLAVLGVGLLGRQREANRSIGEGEVKESLNSFSFDLLSKLDFNRENTFFSPISVYSALAMTYEGARGKTAEEMASVLRLPEGSPAEGYRSLSNSLFHIEALKVANAIWVQRGFPLRQEYVRRIVEHYGGAVESLDFLGDPEGARERINSYVREKTAGKIEELLKRGSIDALTRLVIANAVHFKGSWRYRFDPSDTFEGDFRTPRGIVKAQMMRMGEVRFNYTDIGTHEVLELPYEGRLSMLIFLPKEGHELTLNDLKRAMESMREEEFEEILIPKFEVTSEYDLNDILIGLGMRRAFDQHEADLTGMYEREKVGENLYISLVRHKAHVRVDEEGTEAAGATGVVAKLTAVRERRVFAADHPFLFLIVDRETRVVLFMGSLVDPTAG
ncbi:MAG: serpin family protein [Candidatus Korarchaeum sp.]